MMIKQSFVGLVGLTLISKATLTALPLGNPLGATWLTEGVLWEGLGEEDECSWFDAWSIRVGYYGDFVFDRRLEVDDKPNDSDIRKTRMMTHGAFFAFNLWDKFDIFAVVGQSKFHVETPASAFDFKILGIPYNDKAEFETETYFSWSLGARVTLWECGPLGFGGEVQYFHTRPRLNYFEVSPLDTFYFNNIARTNYREYQLGLGATYKISLSGCETFIVPYTGVKLSRARFNLDDYLITMSSLFGIGNGILHNLDSHHHWGGVIGVTLVGCSRWNFTAEARFADELALHINSQLRF